MRLPLASSLVLASILVAPAQGGPGCLTKREARALHPKAHLYWHGSRRCWDDRSGRRKIYRDPVFPRIVVAQEPESYEPILLLPNWGPRDLDAMMRFAPWEQRVTGAFP